MKIFALLGVVWTVLLAYVCLRWLTADYFGPTPTGPDVPPNTLFERAVAEVSGRSVASARAGRRPWQTSDPGVATGAAPRSA